MKTLPYGRPYPPIIYIYMTPTLTHSHAKMGIIIQKEIPINVGGNPV